MSAYRSDEEAVGGGCTVLSLQPRRKTSVSIAAADSSDDTMSLSRQNAADDDLRQRLQADC